MQNYRKIIKDRVFIVFQVTNFYFGMNNLKPKVLPETNINVFHFMGWQSMYYHLFYES